MGAADGLLMADDRAAIGIPQAVIAGVDAGEDLAHEARAGGDSDINRGRRVPEHVDAVGAVDIGAQLGDDGGHAGAGNGLDLGEVRQAGFVGEHDGVDAACLQGAEIGADGCDDRFETAGGVVGGVAGQSAQVAHGDDGFAGLEVG